MYGKIFESIYGGSLHGHWEAIVTFEQLIVLCDSEGIIDMMPKAISDTTSIPLKIINKGLQVLQRPDPDSRSPEEEGRRIIPISPHRQWGWKIVNHKYYRDLASLEDKRRKDRDRISEKRKKNKDVAVCRNSSQVVAKVAYTDTDTNKNIGRRKRLPEDFSPNEKHAELASELGVSLDDEFFQFCDYHVAKGSVMADWNRALNTWLRNAKKFGGRKIWKMSDGDLNKLAAKLKVSTRGKTRDQLIRDLEAANG